MIQTIQAGVPIARCDIVCEKTVDAINKYKKTNYRVAPTVFFEFHGTKTSVVEQAEAVQAIAKENGGMDFVWATKPEERTQLWQARHDAYFACLQIKPGVARGLDRRLRADLAPRRVRARDHGRREGLHQPGAAARPHRRRQLPPDAAGRPGQARGDRARQDSSTSAWSSARCKMEGTCTGEHGVGMGKMGSMRMELGDDVIDLMRDIKKVFDPDGLMNPGKVVPLQ